MSIYEKYTGMKFCKIKTKSKAPYESDWPNKPYDIKDIPKGENFGILTGHGDYCIIDIDDANIIKRLRDNINTETLIIQSGSGNGYHLYYKIKNPENMSKNKYILHDGITHVGEILWKGCQGVGAGSVHPNGNNYKVINNGPILEEYAENLENIANIFSKPKTEQIDGSSNFDGLQIRTSKILTSILENDKIMDELSSRDSIQKNDVLFKNMAILYYFNSELEDKIFDFIYKCGYTSKEFDGWLKRAPNMSINEKELSDWVVEYELQGIFGNEDNYDGLKLISESEVLKWEDNESHLIKNLIYENTVNMIYAPPASFKSFLALYMAMALASGENFVDMETKQCNVLYLDKENPKQTYKNRYRGLLKGTGFKTNKKLFTYKAGDILDEGFVLSLKVAIKKHNIKVVVLDTLHRFGNYNEDKADDLNRIYMDCFQPLTEELGVTVIFLHHTTKGEGRKRYRGSSDLEGMCDSIISFERLYEHKQKTNKMCLKAEKNRHGKEIDDLYFELQIESDSNDTIKSANFTKFESEQAENKKEMIVMQIRNLLQEPMSRPDLLTHIRRGNFSDSSIDKVIKEMKEDGIINAEKAGKLTVYNLIEGHRVSLG